VVVLDSSFVIAFHNELDAHHPLARVQMGTLLAGSWGSGLLPEYVFVEVAAVLLRKRGLTVATRVTNALLEAPELELINCAGFFRETLERFQNQSDALSFTDASIVTLALRFAQGRVLTFDQGILSYPGISLAGTPPQ